MFIGVSVIMIYMVVFCVLKNVIQMLTYYSALAFIFKFSIVLRLSQVGIQIQFISFILLCKHLYQLFYYFQCFYYSVTVSILVILSLCASMNDFFFKMREISLSSLALYILTLLLPFYSFFFFSQTQWNRGCTHPCLKHCNRKHGLSVYDYKQTSIQH